MRKNCQIMRLVLKNWLVNYKMKSIDKISQRVVFWTALLILAISSLLLDLIIMFVMLFVNPITTYIFTLVVGLFYGFLFSFLVLDLYHLTKKHHIFLSLYIPFVVVLNIYLIMSGINKLSYYLNIGIKVSPIIISFFLLFSFSLPYLFFGLEGLFRSK